MQDINMLYVPIKVMVLKITIKSNGKSNSFNIKSNGNEVTDSLALSTSWLLLVKHIFQNWVCE